MNLCLFSEGNISVIEARNLQDVAATIAKRAERSGRETGRFEVAVDGALVARQVAVASRIRALEGEPADIGAVAGDGHTEPVSRHEAGDRVRRPAAYNGVHHAARARQEPLAAAERQVIDDARRQTVARIEI